MKLYEEITVRNYVFNDYSSWHNHDCALVFTPRKRYLKYLMRLNTLEIDIEYMKVKMKSKPVWVSIQTWNECLQLGYIHSC